MEQISSGINNLSTLIEEQAGNISESVNSVNDLPAENKSSINAFISEVRKFKVE